MGTLIGRRAYKHLYPMIGQALFLLRDSKLVPAECSALNVGLDLSSALLEQPTFKQPGVIETTFAALVSSMGTDIELCNIDVLFDPLWKIDVIRLILNAGKNRRLFLPWPGIIDGTILRYSEPVWDDYAEYDFAKYDDVYCVEK